MNMHTEIEHDFEEIIYLNKPILYCPPPLVDVKPTKHFTVNWETAQVGQPPTKAQLMTMTIPNLKKVASQGHYSIGIVSHSKNTYYIENISKLKKEAIANSIINIWDEIVCDKQNEKARLRNIQ